MWVAGWIWGTSQARIGICENPAGGPYSEEAFQRLSNTEAGEVTNWSVLNCLAWAAALVAGGHRTGKSIAWHQIPVELLAAGALLKGSAIEGSCICTIRRDKVL